MVLAVFTGGSIAFVGNSVIEYFEVEMHGLLGFMLFAILAATALMAMVAVLDFHDKIFAEKKNDKA